MATSRSEPKAFKDSNSARPHYRCQANPMRCCKEEGSCSSLPQAPVPNYKPVALRWPFLVSLAVVLSIPIVLLEWSCHTLPVGQSTNLFPRHNINLETILTDYIRSHEEQHPSRRAIIVGPPSHNTALSSTSTLEAEKSTITPPPASSAIPDDQPPDKFSACRLYGNCPPNPCDKCSAEQSINNPPTSSWSASHDLPSSGNYATIGTITVTESSGIPESTWANGPPAAGDGNPSSSTSVQQKLPVVTSTAPRETLRPTTLEGVVSTMVTPTTPDGVVSTAIGQTTLEKVVSTFSSKITIDGQEQAIVGTTTLTGVVSSLSEVKTLNGIVSSVAKVTTLRGVVSLIGASYMAVEVVTLKNSMGVPTATSTIMPSALFTPTIVALLGSYGHPTATVTTSAPVQPIVVVLTDSAGVPTATLTEYPTYPSSSTSPSPGTPNTDSTVHVYIITYSDYFIGFFLPTIASVLLSIPIRMIDLTAKQFQPFHALTLRGGAPSHSSLCLQTGGVYGIIASVRSLSDGQPLALFTTLLTLCSVFLVPLASESVAIQLHGKCSPARFYGCAMTLGVYTGPARATMALLGIMVLLIVLILFTLRGWQSGVAANPWSIAGVATLSTNSEIRAILSSVQLGEDGRVKRARLMDALGGHIFRLGYFRSEYGDVDYGIKIQHDAERSETAIKTLDEKGAGMVRPHSNGHANIPIPFITLSVVGRLAFLLFISGLLVVILYYNETFDETGFEHFMDSQSFGVKFLFTMVGVGVTFFWSSFFASMATLSPYYLLSRRPQSASRSVLISQPINAFTGLWSAIQRRHGALGVVAATAILSEFMPILLNNVPKGIMQTWLTHLVCTWLAVAILALMWLVVAGTFFLAWPQLPADPTTVAGAMYYVCDSPVLELFEGLGSLAKKDRDLRVMGEGMKFQLAEAVGMSGTKRITVDGHFDDGG